MLIGSDDISSSYKNFWGDIFFDKIEIPYNLIKALLKIKKTPLNINIGNAMKGVLYTI